MYYNPYCDRPDGHDGDQMGMGMGQMGMMDLSSDASLINDISEAVILEVHAYNFYQRLVRLGMNEGDQQVIARIQRDEVRHHRWFTMMLRMMGPQQPQIPPGELPTELISGIRTAIRNELEAEAFYQNIAYRATTHHVQMHFMHVSMDEQRHASLLQSMLSSL